ncbi:M50 family metallopeptidase [Pseudarthrobacter sp. NPDC092424]|uniref:M50 family metallopeptidase n=1 Tax=Pseudarthrobacter sp. NPDC092424 TaxID=3364415 RepID=UPI0037FD5F64
MNDYGNLLAQGADLLSRTEPPAVSLIQLLMVVAAAAGLAVPRRSWRYFGLLATVTHELGHAFAALTSGQRLSGIRLRLDHSGTTTTYSRSRIAAAWSCFWGYPVPAVAGAALVWAGLNGWAPAAVAVSALLLAASLVFLRNLAGFLITAGAIATCAGLVTLVPAPFQGHIVVVLGLALLVAAVRDLAKLVHVHLRRRDRLATSDAYLLFRATAIPSFIWILLFSGVVAAAWLTVWQQVSLIVPGGT